MFLDKAVAQELESVRADLLHLVQEVESIRRDMNLLVKWQRTMDMILKRSFRSN